MTAELVARQAPMLRKIIKRTWTIIFYPDDFPFLLLRIGERYPCATNPSETRSLEGHEGRIYPRTPSHRSFILYFFLFSFLFPVFLLPRGASKTQRRRRRCGFYCCWRKSGSRRTKGGKSEMCSGIAIVGDANDNATEDEAARGSTLSRPAYFTSSTWTGISEVLVTMATALVGNNPAPNRRTTPSVRDFFPPACWWDFAADWLSIRRPITTIY